MNPIVCIYFEVNFYENRTKESRNKVDKTSRIMD